MVDTASSSRIVGLIEKTEVNHTIKRWDAKCHDRKGEGSGIVKGIEHISNKERNGTTEAETLESQFDVVFKS